MTELRRDVTLNGVAASPLLPSRYRWRALRAFGLDAAPCSVAAGVWFGSTQVTLGRGAFVNRGCLIDGFARVTIGERAYLGMQVTVITSTHDLGPSERRAGRAVGKPVTIGAGAWIGARATILPGVTIGPGAVVGAGAVVTRDVPADVSVAGVPARVIRELDAEDDPA